MNYQVMTFFPPYRKKVFYQLMGKFFAERIYKKKLPYLVNTDQTYWYVVTSKENFDVVAFSSFEKQSKKIEIGDFYCADNLLNGINIKRVLLRKMLLDIKKSFPTRPIVACVNNLEDKHLLELRGFVVYRKTKNFCFLSKKG